MVESAMANLVSQLKISLKKWSPSDQVEAVDLIIASWTSNKWGVDELITCENELENALAADGSLESDIEQRLSTLFGAFDEKVPSERLKNSIIGKLDRAGGSMLDSTQYTENESPSTETWEAAKEFAN